MLFADRVKDSTTSTGTGAIVLSGTAPTGYQTFASAFGSASVAVSYCIADESGPNWEVGTGTFNGSTRITRSAGNVLSGSAGPGALVNFEAGTKDVFCTVPAVALSSLYAQQVYASTYTAAADSRNRIIATGNLTLAAPTGASDGAQVRYWITPTAACSLTLGAGIVIPTSSAFASPVTLTIAKKAKLLLEYDATLNGGQWELTSFINGY